MTAVLATGVRPLCFRKRNEFEQIRSESVGNVARKVFSMMFLVLSWREDIAVAVMKPQNEVGRSFAELHLRYRTCFVEFECGI